MTDHSLEFEPERLHRAAAAGDVDEVKRLLKEGYDPNEFDDLGRTPLHYAAEHAHLSVLAELIASGADVNARDERIVGNTPLGEVAGSCSNQVAKLLIDANLSWLVSWLFAHPARQEEAFMRKKVVLQYMGMPTV